VVLIGELPVQYLRAFESIDVAAAISVSLHFNRNASNSSVKFSVKVVDPVPAAFVAEIVTEKVPPTVGVPVMVPVSASKLAQLGRPMAPYDVGLPEATIL